MAKFVKVVLVFVYVTEVISLNSFDWPNLLEKNLSIENEVCVILHYKHIFLMHNSFLVALVVIIQLSHKTISDCSQFDDRQQTQVPFHELQHHFKLYIN